MINLRYHLVSLAAVFLALAVGIALGAGFLDEAATQTTGGNDQQSEISAALSSFDAGYAAATSSEIIDGQLNDQSVVVFTTPGARSSEVADIVSLLEQAGADVTGQVALTDRLLNPANRQFAEGVATQAGGDEVAVGEGYDRIGAALGRAFLATEESESDQTAQTIRSALTEGTLIDIVDEPTTQANAAVIIAGPRAGASDSSGVVVSQFVRALDEATGGVVVAGPVSAGSQGGVVAVVRDSDAASSVSTVDVTDSSTGRVAVVAALAAELDGSTGSWGTSNSANGAIATP